MKIALIFTKKNPPVSKAGYRLAHLSLLLNSSPQSHFPELYIATHTGCGSTIAALDEEGGDLRTS